MKMESYKENSIFNSYYLFNFSVKSGTILRTSPTIPKSATLKIGANLSLLIAMMYSDSSIPAKC